MSHLQTAAIAVFLAAFGSGCMIVHRIDTIYLEPDGSLTWSVIEKDIRSDQQDLEERNQEERKFLAPLLRGEHELAGAMQQMGAGEVHSTLVRDRRPYVIYTEGSFANAETLAWEFIRAIELAGSASLANNEDHSRFELRIPVVKDHEISDANGELLGNLFSGIRAIEVVVTEGEIIAAEGFEFEEGGSTARFDFKALVDADLQPGSDFVLSLSYRAKRAEPETENGK